MSSEQPLSELARSLMEADSMPSSPYVEKMHKHHEKDCHGWWAFVFYFLVFAVAFYFLYFALRPHFVLKQCGSHSDSRSFDEDRELDNGRLLGAAIVSALVLIFVLWLFFWAVYGF